MLKKVLKVIGIVAAVFVVLIAAVLIVFSISEYRPADLEQVTVDEGSAAADVVSVGDSIDVVSWNVGYCALGEGENFFMDGGSNVRAGSAEEVQTNIAAIRDFLADSDADVIFLQETDLNADRSFNINESDLIWSAVPEMDRVFAYNYNSLYVPYPLPVTLGHIEGGLTTYTDLEIREAERVQLPCPFSWPVRIFNLRRCLLVSRVPVEGTDAELVLINLHLEAYDSGEGKIAQTAMLARILQEEYEAGNYVIAGGDFNQSFSNIDTSMYPLQREDLWAPGLIDAESFSDDLSLLMDNSVPTCRSLDREYDPADPDFQYYMIDGFIVSDNLTVESLETLNMGFVNSDHNPVALTVTLN